MARELGLFSQFPIKREAPVSTDNAKSSSTGVVHREAPRPTASECGVVVIDNVHAGRDELIKGTVSAVGQQVPVLDKEIGLESQIVASVQAAKERSIVANDVEVKTSMAELDSPEGFLVVTVEDLSVTGLSGKLVGNSNMNVLVKQCDHLHGLGVSGVGGDAFILASSHMNLDRKRSRWKRLARLGRRLGWKRILNVL
ncbi:hypothetical protein ACOSQ3_014283 [Xanthoceras sorbifolium]